MRFSRLGILVLILTTVFLGTNCSYYNRIMARKSLVDGASAYKNRKFAEAEQLFRNAVSRDPDGKTLEGKTAQLFLARTLHSEYIGDRGNRTKAEEAVKEYQKVLRENPNDQSSFKAVANLYENLQMPDDWLKWVTERSNNEAIPKEQRSEALTSLAAKKNGCASDVTDVEAVKKTVTGKDGKQVFQFVKPANPEDFDRLKKCTEEGMELTGKAVEFDPNSDSAWSYRTNMLVQKMRIAEMEGNTAEKDSYKKQADEAKAKFTVLAEAKRKKEEEEAAKKKAEEEAANTKKK
jgi:tetratricopeptide (TPR) repeat protein